MMDYKTGFNKAIAIILVLLMLSVYVVYSDRTITDISDDIYTMIYNSKGNYTTATAANAQLLINQLNNQTGWVDFNRINITLTKTLNLSANCEIRNFHFYLGDSVNKTMIMNYDLTNGKNGIYIHDGYINGNGINQPNQNSTSVLIYQQPCGIFLVKCSNSTVRDVTIYNTEFGGLFFQQSKNNIAENIKVFQAGRHHMVAAYTPGDCYSALGIYYYNCSDGAISNCLINTTWSAGIVLESTLPSIVKYRTHHITVSNCVVSNTTVAYYMEDASKVSFSNCVAKSGKKYWIPLSMAFLGKVGTTDNITITGCQIDCFDNGIGMDTNNLTIVGCSFNAIGRYAIELGGDDLIVSDCRIIKPSDMGIYINGGKRVTLTGNHIYGGCGWGYSINLAATKNVTLSGNEISQSALHYPDYGVFESTTCNWTRIGADNNIAVTNEKVHLHGTNSWYMIVNTTTGRIGMEVGNGSSRNDIIRWS